MFKYSNHNITILTTFDRISLFHTLKPFLFYRPPHRGGFHFKLTDSVEECLELDRNRSLLVLRMPKVQGLEPADIMKALREKYDRLVFFNDGAAAGTNNFDFLPYVDRFIVKSIFRDQSQSLQPLYRRRLFTDYYHRKDGVRDPDLEAADSGESGEAEKPAESAITRTSLDKLRLGWNIGVGDFPREDLRQRAGVFTARTFHPGLARFFFRRRMPAFLAAEEGPGSTAAGRDIPVHARLGALQVPSVNRQREIFLDMIKKDPRFLTGRTTKQQYDGEMRRSLMTLSPFGWGEVCFRDFEALFAGSLLLKPDMGHIETWPDIYRPGETYVPLSWDGDDLFEQVEYYLSRPGERVEMVRNARELFRTEIEGLPERFTALLEEVFG